MKMATTMTTFLFSLATAASVGEFPAYSSNQRFRSPRERKKECVCSFLSLALRLRPRSATRNVEQASERDVDVGFFVGVISLSFAALASDTSGPFFVEEPPNQVDFSNTTGAEVICQARGTPMPKITWVRADDDSVVRDVPGLRQVQKARWR